MLYILPFIVAMVVTMAWLPLFARLAGRLGVLDRPGARKVHSLPIPRVGGLAMLLGVLIAAAMLIPLEPRDMYFLIAASVLAAFGALDDRLNLDYRIKLLGQLLAVCIVAIAGDVQIHSVSLDERVLLPQWLSLTVTVVFLVGITNAINLADGLDGLAGGTTFLCLAALAMLAHSCGQQVGASLALAFAGAVLGFLRFNTYPATVFMGDAGSQLLGFAIGVLSLRATQSGESAISAALPLLLFALPIMDTLSVMAQRVSEGRSPFSADKNHIHHKLLRLGFDHHEAVTVIYMIQADLFLLAYWMRYESDLIIAGVVAAIFAIFIGLFQFALRRDWRFRETRSGGSHAGSLSRLLSYLRAPEHLPRWSYLMVALAVGAYAALVMTRMIGLSGDIRILAVALLTLILSLLAVLRSKPLSIVEKAVLYVTSAILVYADGAMPSVSRVWSVLSWLAIGAAAVGTVLRLRLTPDRRFVLTPLDLIVLFVALVVPSLPGVWLLPDGIAASVAKLVALFYAIEVLVSRIEIGAVWVRVVAAAILSGLILRPFIPAI
jgi:UDP-GlcNAc:undecaprenyl-phosphate GlcNAc-1-phosphate transferase